MFFFWGRVAPVCTGVNSIFRVDLELTTRTGPHRTAATLQAVSLLSKVVTSGRFSFDARKGAPFSLAFSGAANSYIDRFLGIFSAY